MATITITKSEVQAALLAESTNAARTMRRQDGVSEFEDGVIDAQAMSSLMGAWHEANAKLTEKMHEFLTDTTVNDTTMTYTFGMDYAPDLLAQNIKMFIVDWMMADWLASVRPDFRQRYLDRCTTQMDDLLRKLYKKEAPV